VTRLTQILLAAVIGTPLLLAAIEGGLRLAGVESAPRILFDKETCYVAFEPGTHLHRVEIGLEHDLWLDEQGFRVPAAVARGERPIEASRCRVLALGDSYTEGFFVTAEETWPSQLEQILRARGYEVGVDNGGFRNISIVPQRYAALTRWAPLRHDLVVLQHTSNDIQDLISARRDGCVEPRLGPLAGLRIWRIAQEAAARLQAALADPQSAPPSAEECDAMSVEYREQLLELARAISADGRHFVFVQMEPFHCAGFPVSAGEQPARIWNPYVAALRRGLAEAGAEYVDVTDELMRPDRSLRPADTHPNAAAYAAMATRIADHIEASTALEQCRR